MSRWQEVALGEVCKFKYGKSLPAAGRVGGHVPVFGSSGPVGSHNVALSSGPTIIVGRKGSLGEVYYSPIPAWAIDTAYFVDASCTEADLRWLFHRLRGLGLTELNRAAAVPGLNRDDAYRCRLLLPPRSEQRRIAEVLDRAEALRAKRRNALAGLHLLKEAIFIELFGDPSTNPKGWPVSTIGELLESASYGTSERATLSGELPVLRMNNLTRYGDLDLSELKFMNLKEDQRERYTVRAGDVLFNRTNSRDLVGKTAIFRNSEPMAYAGYLVRLRVNHENDGEYLAAFLNTAHSKRVLRSMCKSIIGMANINATEAQAMAIPRPPLDLQLEFARRVAAVEAFKQVQASSMAKLDGLFVSIQHRAFRGEL